ncbi:Hypothetical protein R9X50_00417200 [Acrodontium crateriforme]|uniref:Uncharacterized protein n=1 Tax=Acrodontium crateriforme TaxID=150365 RepID=A0AAQ3M3V3_9PEZI|nr:Hypothetical protein R9X50_00417200 [Acrodontium crateriforme]
MAAPSRFVFIHHDETEHSQTKSSRSVVRSAAAVYSHRVAPRRGSRIAKAARRGQNHGMASFDSIPTALAACTPARSPSSDEELPLSSSESTETSLAHRDAHYGPQPTLYYTLLDKGRSDPFYTYPVEHHKWFDWLFEFWYGYVLPLGKPHIRANDEILAEYTHWSRRQEISEPCLFYTSLFLATGIPVTRGLITIEAALWLRGMAVKTLQEALNDPDRALTNATISAVTRVALHEHIYGNRQLSQDVHRPAQKRMIAMRGGLEAVGMPDSVLHMMAWSDAIMAAESSTPSNFTEYSDYLARRGIYRFAPAEAINATAIVSPQRHKHPGYDKMTISAALN